MTAKIIRNYRIFHSKFHILILVRAFFLKNSFSAKGDASIICLNLTDFETKERNFILSEKFFHLEGIKD